MAGEDWTDHEKDLTMADDFAMLEDDLAGLPYSKAGHNLQLQARSGRGRGAIEFKHQNISAVLKGLVEVWIEGYKPTVNFLMSLFDAVLRWMTAHPEWANRSQSVSPIRQMNDAQPLWVGPPGAVRPMRTNLHFPRPTRCQAAQS